MKTICIEKVKEIAIDLPNRRQFYVADPKKKQLVIDTLIDLGFTGNIKEITKQPHHYPIVVNTIEKEFFVIPTGLMACAAQSGAKVVDYQTMIEKLIMIDSMT